MIFFNICICYGYHIHIFIIQIHVKIMPISVQAYYSFGDLLENMVNSNPRIPFVTQDSPFVNESPVL